MTKTNDPDQIREMMARKILRRCLVHPSWVPISGPLGNGRQCTECGYQERT